MRNFGKRRVQFRWWRARRAQERRAHFTPAGGRGRAEAGGAEEDPPLSSLATTGPRRGEEGEARSRPVEKEETLGLAAAQEPARPLPWRLLVAADRRHMAVN